MHIGLKCKADLDESTIDDVADPIYRHTSLRDVGSEDDLPRIA